MLPSLIFFNGFIANPFNCISEVFSIKPLYPLRKIRIQFFQFVLAYLFCPFVHWAKTFNFNNIIVTTITECALAFQNDYSVSKVNLWSSIETVQASKCIINNYTIKTSNKMFSIKKLFSTYLWLYCQLFGFFFNRLFKCDGKLFQ